LEKRICFSTAARKNKTQHCIFYFLQTALVDSNQQQYFAANLNIEKNLIVQRIIFQIHESGGRFLLFDNERQAFYPNDMEAARAKVAHALQHHRQRPNISILTGEPHDELNVKRQLDVPSVSETSSSPSSKKRTLQLPKSLRSMIRPSSPWLTETQEEKYHEIRQDLLTSDAPSKLQTMRSQVLIMQHELEQARTVIRMLRMELKHTQMQNERLKKQFGLLPKDDS
jgi:hypothetical protein